MVSLTNSHLRTRKSFFATAAPTRAHLAMLSSIAILVIGYKGVVEKYGDALHNVGYSSFLVALICISILFIKYKNKLNNIAYSSNSIVLVPLLLNTLCLSSSILIDNNILMQLLFLNTFILFSWLCYGNKLQKTIFLPMLLLFGLVTAHNEYQEFLFHTLQAITIKILAWDKQNIFWNNNLIKINNITYTLDNLHAFFQYSFHYLVISYTIALLSTEKFFKISLLFVNLNVTPLLGISISLIVIIKLEILNQNNNFDFWLNIFMALSMLSTFVLAIIIGNIKEKHHNRHIDWHNSYRFSKYNWLNPTLISICIMLTIPYLSNYFQNNIVTHKGSPEIILPHKLNNWSLDNDTVTQIYHPTKSITNVGLYTNNSDPTQKIWLSSQNFIQSIDQHLSGIKVEQNSTIINTKNRIFIVNNNKFKIKETITRKMAVSQLNWTFYQIHNVLTDETNTASVFDQLLTAIKHDRKTNYLKISTNIDHDATAASLTLEKFLQDLIPELNNINTIYWKINSE